MTVSFRPPPATTVITGAAGWLGTALLHELTSPDARWGRTSAIRAVVRSRSEAEHVGTISPLVEPVVADITRPDTLAASFAGVSGDVDVIHTAGVIHPGRVAEFDAVNAAGTRHVLEAARAAGVRRVVHVSSNSPFGTNPHAGDRFRNDEPYHPYYGYGWSKMHAELAVFDAVADGLDAVIVRPPWFYGPHQPLRQTTFFKLVRRGRFPVFGDGGQMRSMVFVGSLVDGVCRAELANVGAGSAWWIADARPYRVDEIVATVARSLRDEGLAVVDRRLRLPDAVGRLAELADSSLQRFGRYQQQVHVLGEMNKHIACDIETARHELGFEPSVSLYDGMRRSVRWCLDRGMAL